MYHFKLKETSGGKKIDISFNEEGTMMKYLQRRMVDAGAKAGDPVPSEGKIRRRGYRAKIIKGDAYGK